jgi:hypothetical protein
MNTLHINLISVTSPQNIITKISGDYWCGQSNKRRSIRISFNNCLGGVGGILATGKILFKTSRTRFVEPPQQTFFIVVDIINKIK